MPKVNACRRGLAALAVLCLAGAALAFTDLSQSQYGLAIVYLSGRGILGGYPDGSYRPAAPVSRAELTVAVMRARNPGGPAPRALAEPCFMDLPSGNWAVPYICAAKTAGIVGGESAGRFDPAAPVSYAEAAKIALTGLVPGFRPPPLLPWYVPYLDAAEAQGLFGGQPYNPGSTLSRDAMAKLLYETLALNEDVTPLTYPSGHYSEGCGAPPPADPPSSLLVNGLRRDIITALPADYHNDHTYALVVAFHGRTSPAAQVRRYFRLEGDNTDTIFVYPSALPAANGGFSWFDPGDPPDALRDYAFFDAILAAFRSSYCLDTRRVFVVGHSLGAHFANSLACARGSVVRAVGSLGGGVSASACSGRVAAMLLHNPADRLAPIASGEAARDLFLRVDGLADWGAPVPTEPRSLNCVRYGPPRMAHPVVWCPHHQDYGYGGRYYPHNWPRAAGPAIMAFFRSLP